MRRRILTLGLVLALAPMVGCAKKSGGGAAPSPSPAKKEGPTKAEFIAAADKICKETDDKLNALPEPEDPEALDTYVQQFLAAVDEMTAKLEDLEPPQGDEQVHKELVNRIELLRGKAEETFKAEDDETSAKLEAEGNELSSDLAKFAGDYGFEECGAEE